jgi:hypothetical protein
MCQQKQVMKVRNPQVITDRTTSKNKPYIIIRDNEKGTCLLIDTEI